MPGDSYIQLPDNSYIHLTGEETPDQLSALRTKLSGMQTPEGRAYANPPVATPASWQQPRDPYSGQAYGNAVPPQMAQKESSLDRIQGQAGQIQNISSTPVTNAASGIMPAAGAGEAIAQRGLLPFLQTAGRGIAKSAAGTAAGASLGGTLGYIFGHPKEGAQIGATVGGLSLPFLPNRVLASMPYGANRAFLTNEELAAEQEAMRLAQRNAGLASGRIDPVSQAVRERRAAWLPTIVNPTPNALALPQGQGPEAVAGTRPNALVLTPEEAASEEQMQAIAKKRASERGMQFAAGMTPREGKKVPRMPATTASTQYPNPRQVVAFDDEGNPL